MASPSEQLPRAGLRERKKARTRAAIQDAALRLFERQGYAETTVDEIAAAAEVSQSTFFRYFPTKEELVAYDALDPIWIDAYRAQPAGLTPLEALISALTSARETLPLRAWEQEQRRKRIFGAEPELRPRLLGDALRSLDLLAQLFAERTGRDADDFELRALAGAVTGVTLPILLADHDDAASYFAAIERAMRLLLDGFATL
ncbi:TetR family transcriptional regulator [Conexibacter sp. JD483]|uniref:TetR family transcriptional regulator n=1 Tax=unclassified Conexibacter TaxID=2627773 RepID=UPI0027268D0F|nr:MULTISPECIES: TetR family transcriptional regulator [unclassified Conexibacter]MDO8189385.1 TetR family transcriptional regulator [Conexibacter sp. CPCC 205706]MDO8201092.1 TetR family transcriptional regulator [Conexibacter sp. CPCC 205762]MDR9372446.1 TetR family transcriptional regulator [Conexibacter sp. JD483]